MPWITALWSTFVAIAPQLLNRLAIGLGVGVVTYHGVKALLDYAMTEIQAQFSTLPTLAIQVAAVCRVDDAITVVMSAWVVRLTFQGLTAAGAMKKVLWRPGQQGDLFN